MQGSRLSQPGEQLRHGGAKAGCDDAKALEGQVLLAPFHSTHKISVQAAGVCKGLLGKFLGLAQSADSTAELLLQLFHFQ